MLLAILPKNNDLNGAKLSQFFFHFQSLVLFFLQNCLIFKKCSHFYCQFYSIMHFEKKLYTFLENQRNDIRK